METIRVLHSQLGADFLATVRRMPDEEQQRYTEGYRGHMMLMTGEPVFLPALSDAEVYDLAHIAGKDIAGYLPRSSGELYTLTDEEWAALIAANQQAAAAKAAAERAGRIDYLRDLLARADAQRVDGKLPSAADAREKERKWNNVYNEGGEGYVPRCYTQEEYARMAAELDKLTAEVQEENA